MDWTPGFVDPNTDNLVNIESGTYQLNIVDDNGCIYDTTFIISTPAPIYSNGTVTNVSCSGLSDGAITLNLTGGTGSLNTTWTGPPGFVDPNTDNLVNIESGTYQLNIVDDNGCIYDTTFIISTPAPIYSNGTVTNVSCSGLSDGAITLNLTGGTGSLNTTWTGPPGFVDPNTDNLVNIESGTYQLNIVDDNGCIYDTTFIISTPAPIYSNGTVTNVSCSGLSDGAITLNLTGGTGSLNTTWTGPPGFVDPNTDNLVNIESGTYQLNIVDDNGCIYDTTFIISTPAPIYSNGTVTNVSCSGLSDGAITLNLTGGTGSLNTTWTGPPDSLTLTQTT